jgi:hypothetical protein
VRVAHNKQGLESTFRKACDFFKFSETEPEAILQTILQIVRNNTVARRNIAETNAKYLYKQSLE